METMTLRVPVAIKVVVTESLKEKLVSDLEARLKAVEQDLMQIEFQEKRVLADQAKLDVQGLTQIRQQIDESKHRALGFKQEVETKLEEARNLTLGTELPQGQLEQQVTVQVGDDLDSLMEREILIEDGVIKAFRG